MEIIPPDGPLGAYVYAFAPLSAIVAQLARAGAPPRTVAHLTEAMIRQRASANAHERAAIYQYCMRTARP